MDPVLSKFLSPCQRFDGYYTHVSQLDVDRGKYCIDVNEEDEFWDIYCSSLQEKGDDFVNGMSERPREYMPILVDIDFKFDLEGDDAPQRHFYQLRHVEALIRIYIDVLKYVIGEDNYDRKHLCCFLLEKKKPYVDGDKVKNGFHLHFPFIYVSKLDYEVHIIPRIEERIESENIFVDILGYGDGCAKKALDKASNEKFWLLYGSRKGKYKEAYKLTRVYNWRCQEIALDNVFINSDPSMNNFITDAHGRVIHFDKESDFEYYLPRILSVKGVKRPTYTASPEIECITKKKLIKVKDMRGNVENNLSVGQALELCRRLVPLLSGARAEARDTWMQVGWCIYSITQGAAEGLDLWIAFSKKTTRGNFNEKECVYVWNSKMYVGGYTLGSLRMWCEIDAPHDYAVIKLEEQRSHIKASLDGGHSDFARMLYDLYSKDYICCNIKKNIWYKFSNHRWIETDSAIDLRLHIHNDILPRYVEESKALNNLAHTMENADDQATAISRVNKINKIIVKLKDNSFKNNIMKECYELFYKSDFHKKLDQNKYLICFANGVLDLQQGSFREGRPEDYCSMCTGYDWKEFENDDPEVEDVQRFFEKIFPDDDLRQYFLEWAGSLYKGGNDTKTFLVMSGKGDNGKSVVIDFLQQVLGDYAITFPTTLLTGKATQSSAATPELARAPGARLSVLQEPDDKAELNNGVLKLLTGNDKVFVRPLFKEGFDMRPQYKLAFICNKLPKIPAEDDASWERLRRLQFKSKFPKNPFEVPQSYEEQVKQKVFPRDNKFTEKLPFMVPAFAWLMFQYYKRVAKRGHMPDPNDVIEATLYYRQINDFYLQFMSENLIKDENKNTNPDGLTLNELFENFKDWYRTNMSGKGYPTRMEVKEAMVKKLGPLEGNKWKKWRMKEDKDEVAEGHAIEINEDDHTDYENTDTEAETDVDVKEEEEDDEEEEVLVIKTKKPWTKN
jgi:P4 family phage/plasmid primase-like protien